MRSGLDQAALVFGRLAEARHHDPGLGSHQVGTEDERRADALDRSRDQGSHAAVPQSHLTGDLRLQRRVLRKLHQGKRVGDPASGSDGGERRVREVAGERRLEQSVERGIAGAVVEPSDQDGVSLLEAQLRGHCDAGGGIRDQRQPQTGHGERGQHGGRERPYQAPQVRALARQDDRWAVTVERGEDVGRGLKAVERIALEAAEDRPLPGPVQTGQLPSRRRRRPRETARCHGVRRIADERHLARDHLVQGDSESVDVGCLGDLAALQLLRGHVGGSAQDLPRLGELAGARLRMPAGRQAEVGDHGPRAVLLVHQHDVRGLQVAVHDPFAVCSLEGRDDLFGDRARFLELQTTHSRESLLQGLAVEHLHGEHCAAVELKEVEHPAGVRMGDAARQCDLSTKAGVRLLAGSDLRPQHLEGDARAELQILRLVHGSHAAPAEKAQHLDPVGEDAAEGQLLLLAGQEGGVVVSRQSVVRRRPVEDLGALLVRSEELTHIAQDLGIGAALFQNGLTARAVELQRIVEELPLAVPALADGRMLWGRHRMVLSRPVAGLLSACARRRTIAPDLSSRTVPTLSEAMRGPPSSGG